MKRTQRTWAALSVAAVAGLSIVSGTVVARGFGAGPGHRSTQAQTAATPGPAGSPMMGKGMMGNGGMGNEGMSGGTRGGGTSQTASGSMMGGDMGKIMGTALANAPGDRVSASDVTALGSTAPNGATVDQAGNRITFKTQDVHLTVLASPADGPDMTFRIAGLADPTIVVPKGATVTVQFIDADSDTSHGWLLTSAQPPFSYMAMMEAPAAISGSFATPLGDPTTAGMHSETISFTASTPGQYTYLCPVAAHAQQGMHGTFIVSS